MDSQALWITKYGEPEVLVLQNETPAPPAAGEVRIDVAYSGVNFADLQMRRGLYPDAPKRPFVPGYEVSGVVRDVGEGVTEIGPGDQVVAVTYFGGYRSTVTVPATQVFPLPKGWTLAEGAAIPVTFFTAHLAITEMGRLRAGDRVLIDCASGGVGTIAMQLAKARGAQVVGLTSSPQKKAFIEGYGARAFTHAEFAANPALRDFDLILNAGGGRSINQHRRRLALTGRIVCFGVNSGMTRKGRGLLKMLLAVVQSPLLSVLGLLDQNQGVFGLNALRFFDDPQWVERLTKTLPEVERLNIRPHVDKVFPAQQAAEAHRYIQEKRAKGKVLLRWGEAQPQQAAA